MSTYLLISKTLSGAGLCRSYACYLSPYEFISVTILLISRPFFLGILHLLGLLPSFCFLFWRCPCAWKQSEEQQCSSVRMKVHWNAICNFSIQQSTPVSLQQHPRGFHYFHRHFSTQNPSECNAVKDFTLLSVVAQHFPTEAAISILWTVMSGMSALF